MSTQTQTQTTDQTIVEFQRSAYKEVCAELRDVLQKEKEIAKRKEELKNSVLQLSGGDRMEYGIKVQKRVTRGTIDYKKIAVDMGFSEEEAEEYRKSTRTYWDVRSY